MDFSQHFNQKGAANAEPTNIIERLISDALASVEASDAKHDAGEDRTEEEVYAQFEQLYGSVDDYVKNEVDPKVAKITKACLTASQQTILGIGEAVHPTIPSLAGMELALGMTQQIIESSFPKEVGAAIRMNGIAKGSILMPLLDIDNSDDVEINLANILALLAATAHQLSQLTVTSEAEYIRQGGRD